MTQPFRRRREDIASFETPPALPEVTELYGDHELQRWHALNHAWDKRLGRVVNEPDEFAPTAPMDLIDE